MKVISIIIFKKEGQNIDLKKEAYNVSDVPFFYRSKTKDLLKFLSKTVAERIQTFKLCVTEKDYIVYASNNNNYVITVITDKEYPQRVAFSMLDKISQEIENINLETMIEKYQNPNEVDQILKIQNNIESTKFTMVDAIDKVLARGEKIDELVVKSSDLSEESKIFYKDAKKMNSWCSGCTIQ
jgi:synaptobrevin family protein YKT6